MKDRVVSRLMLSGEDEISYLLGPWGAIDAAKAIEQIETGARRYFVLMDDGFLVEIHVVGGAIPRLRVDCDVLPANRLTGAR